MPTLEVMRLSKQFPAVKALSEVDLNFQAGEVHGVIGENGAGKSTLMKILSGLQPPSSGVMRLDGQPVAFHGVRDAMRRGIVMIHQELNLVDDLTVAENIYLGREKTRAGLIDRAAMRESARQALAEVGAQCDPDDPVGGLSIAAKQLVEIAKALSYDASILIMDEPTAVLSEPESEALFSLIARLKAKGVTVLYVSHRLAEVCAICDRISVLRDGQYITTIPGPQSRPADLAKLMVGREMADFYPPKAESATGDPIFEARNIVVDRWVRGVSLSVRPGEIVGLAGLVGAGRTEFCEALVGARPMRSGEVLIDGKAVRIRNPRDAKRHGIAYVSEDRKGLGLIVNMPVVDNTTLANLEQYSHGLLDRKAEVAATLKWKSDLDVRVGDIEAPILFLSGGNQQKISIAKWLETQPRVLILDEPTRGVDVGAKREMYNLIQDLASRGLACIVVSSELVEIIGLCHRAVVLREGVAMGEVSGSDMNEASMMALAAGVEA